MAYTKTDGSDVVVTRDDFFVLLAMVGSDELCCTKYTFNGNCDVHFYSEGELDVVGAVSSTDAYLPSTGNPTDPSAIIDDDSGSGYNFDISFSTSAGDVYYLWYRTNGSASGWASIYVDITNYVEPPSPPDEDWNLVPINLYGVTEDIYDSERIAAGNIYRYRMWFNEGGRAHFRIEDSTVSVYMCLTKSGDVGVHGLPSGEILNDIGGTSGGMRYDVAAGDVYYLWIRAQTYGSSGYTDYAIIPPESAPPTQTWSVDDWSSRTIYDGDGIAFQSGDPGGFHISCVPIIFDEPGAYAIGAYSNDSYNGWLTTTKDGFDYDNGVPTSGIIGADTSSSAGMNFTVADIETSTRYYFWFRTADGSANPRNYTPIFLRTTPPVANWSYDSSQGNIWGISEDVTDRRFSVSVSTGVRIGLSFMSPGTYTFYSTSPGTSLLAYLTPDTLPTAFDTSTGVPYDYLAGDTVPDAQGNFSFTFNVPASNIRYYLWVKPAEPDAAGNFYLNIKIPSRWSYTDGASITNIASPVTHAGPYSVSEETGVKIMLRFSQECFAELSSSLAGTDLYAYLTDGDSGFDTETGVPYNAIGSSTAPVQSNFLFTHSVSEYNSWSGAGTYYLWVRAKSATGRGTFRLNIDFTNWTYTTLGAQTGVTRYSVTRTFTSGNGYRIPITFATSGLATFRTTQSGSLQAKTVGYVGTSPSASYDRTTGEPDYYTWSDAGVPGSENFTITQRVTAGMTYYLWVRGKTGQDTGSITIEASVGTGTGKCWAFISNMWRRVMPFVYKGTGSNQGWKAASPYVFITTGTSGWKPCT